MGYQVHEKNTARGVRYRIWSTNSDSYWDKPITKDELEETLLEYEVTRAIRMVVDQFHNKRLRTEKVAKWEEELNKHPPMSKSEEDAARKDLAEIYGAAIEVTVETLPDKTKKVTAKIEPVI
ncbi:MAG: hypothetical protein Q7R63_02375 [bacterium]|nr:hypothetical protein [bacterium]